MLDELNNIENMSRVEQLNGLNEMRNVYIAKANLLHSSSGATKDQRNSVANEIQKYLLLINDRFIENWKLVENLIQITEQLESKLIELGQDIEIVRNDIIKKIEYLD